MSIAFQGEIIIESGRITDVRQLKGRVRLSLNGKAYEYPNVWVLPGLVDSHAHVVGLGLYLREGYLTGCRSKEECVARVGSIRYSRGEWIIGRGWNQEQWNQSCLPNRFDLDELFPSIPIALTRVDGHALWVNSCALERAGISPSTPDPTGGRILRDKNGEPTGILLDNAMELVLRLIPEPTDDELVQAIQNATRLCNAAGLTEIHDMDVNPTHLSIFTSLAENGKLYCRILSWVRGQNFEWHKAGILPTTGQFHRVQGVKLFADGALGSRGAALLEPYSDDQSTCGILMLDVDDIIDRVECAINDGFKSLAVHAIGDHAVRVVLNAYRLIRKKSTRYNNLLLRIEHSQIVHPDDLSGYADESIIASVQPIHCISDASMAESRLGNRVHYAYPWRSLIERGVLVCAGSDFPIESYNPLTGIDAFCRRTPPGMLTPWYGKERVTRTEAIRAYTTNAHCAAGMEYARGYIAPGMDADLVILDRNIETCDDGELLDTRIIATVVAGKLFEQCT